MTFGRMGFVLGLVVSMLAACSGGSTGGGSGGGVSCDPIANSGPTVAAVNKSGPLPAMTGGTIADGTYVETGYEYYAGTTGSGTHKEVMVFANGTVKNVDSDDGKPDVVTAGTYSTSGTTLTFDIACPQKATLTAQYTATPTTLMFVANTGLPNRLETWTKQ